MARGRQLGTRTLGVVALLASSLVLVLILAHQALSAASYHRETVHETLRNYAAMAGWEFMRRVQVGLRYPLYEGADLLRALATDVAAGEGSMASTGPAGEAAAPVPGLPAPAVLAGTAGERARQALPLMEYLFCSAGGRLLVSAPGPPAAVQTWMEANLTAALAGGPLPGREYGMHAVVIGEELEILVFLPPAAGSAAGSPLCGFAVRRQALGQLFAKAYGEEPLLPPSIGYPGLERDSIHVTVDDEAGRNLFRSPGTLEPELASYRPLGNEIPGLAVRSSIQREAVAGLVSGGLPSSRVPALLALLALTLGLLLTAIHQLRRQQELERLRSDFVSSVSHELRTPLTQIRMFTEMLRLGRVRSDAEAARSLEIIDHESRRLTHLVENILQFSRAERGALRLMPERLDLAVHVGAAAQAFGPLAASAGATLQVSVPANLEVWADPDALCQVILNFLDNAVRYGPRGQEVRIGASIEASAGAGQERKAHGLVQLWVEDQGPGIKPQDRLRIWNRFERLGRNGGGIGSGTGIGLAVVRDLVERQGGRVWVSQGERGGARFVAAFRRGREGEAA